MENPAPLTKPVIPEAFGLLFMDAALKFSHDFLSFQELIRLAKACVHHPGDELIGWWAEDSLVDCSMDFPKVILSQVMRLKLVGVAIQRANKVEDVINFYLRYVSHTMFYDAKRIKEGEPPIWFEPAVDSG